jgi:hypothetical protein
MPGMNGPSRARCQLPSSHFADGRQHGIGTPTLFNANDTAPYGLDGRAADNAAVVDRFDDTFALGSESGAKRDLVAYREAVSHNRAPFDTQNRVFDRREFESFAADHQTSIADREPVIVALAVAAEPRALYVPGTTATWSAELAELETMAARSAE